MLATISLSIRNTAAYRIALSAYAVLGAIGALSVLPGIGGFLIILAVVGVAYLSRSRSMSAFGMESTRRWREIGVAATVSLLLGVLPVLAVSASARPRFWLLVLQELWK